MSLDHWPCFAAGLAGTGTGAIVGIGAGAGAVVGTGAGIGAGTSAAIALMTVYCLLTTQVSPVVCAVALI